MGKKKAPLTKWDKWQTGRGRDVLLPPFLTVEPSDVADQIQQNANRIMDRIVGAAHFLRLSRQEKERALGTINPEALLLLASAEDKIERRNSAAQDSETVTARPGAGLTLPTARDDVPMDLINHCVLTMDFTLFNDVAYYISDHVITDEKTSGLYWIVPHVAGLRAWRDPVIYRTPDFSPYSTASAEERAVQHSVIQAVFTLGYDHRRHAQEVTGLQTRRLSWEIMTFLAKNPEKSDRMIDLILKREIDTRVHKYEDYESIMEAHNGVVNPMQDGVL